jgi:hypothetical protein
LVLEDFRGGAMSVRWKMNVAKTIFEAPVDRVVNLIVDRVAIAVVGIGCWPC